MFARLGLNVYETKIENGTYKILNKKLKVRDLCKAEVEFWNNEDRVKEFSERPVSNFICSTLEKNVGKNPVLDFGCGSGRISVLMARLGFDVFGIDSSDEMLKMARSKLKEFYGGEVSRRFLKASMFNLPYPNGTFKMVISAGVYHQVHSLSELKVAFDETARVLLKGGVLVVEVFTCCAVDFLSSNNSLVVTKEGLHMTLVTADEFKELARESGLKIIGGIEEIKTIETGERQILRAVFERM